ncbi:ATP-binding protein [Sphaerisporangium rufum]|uniref:ATP-binding protein n=1 Tax=Sphaerisporangium rufum TaxID=1381558 RepID=A0A919R0Q7_9ACTN|nr:ATP-binding protein [Sphaerisporangium rufum]GII77223.1 ATP-binding protein [Sphaerisporangium rufum]
MNENLVGCRSGVDMKPTGVCGEVELAGELRSVPVARAWVRAFLASAGRCDVGDVELLVGELVANAVRHSDSGHRPGGVVWLRVHDDGRAVRAEVTDEGSSGGVPSITTPVDPMSEGGRGLWLVRELSSAWGWHPTGTGRTVWTEVVPGPEASAPDGAARGVETR